MSRVELVKTLRVLFFVQRKLGESPNKINHRRCKKSSLQTLKILKKKRKVKVSVVNEKVNGESSAGTGAKLKLCTNRFLFGKCFKSFISFCLPKHFVKMYFGVEYRRICATELTRGVP